MELADRLGEIVQNKDMVAAGKVGPPESLRSRLGELYVLGPAGGALLHLVGALNATKQIVHRSFQLMADTDVESSELWPSIEVDLNVAIQDAEEAIAGIAAQRFFIATFSQRRSSGV